MNCFCCAAVVSVQALSAYHIVIQYVLLILLQTSRSQYTPIQPRNTHSHTHTEILVTIMR